MKKATKQALDGLESIWADVEAARNSMRGPTLPRPPKNSITINKYAQKYNISPATARQQLLAMVKVGRMTRTRAWAVTEVGRVAALWHFTPVK